MWPGKVLARGLKYRFRNTKSPTQVLSFQRLGTRGSVWLDMAPKVLSSIKLPCWLRC